MCEQPLACHSSFSGGTNNTTNGKKANAPKSKPRFLATSRPQGFSFQSAGQGPASSRLTAYRYRTAGTSSMTSSHLPHREFCFLKRHPLENNTPLRRPAAVRARTPPPGRVRRRGKGFSERQAAAYLGEHFLQLALGERHGGGCRPPPPTQAAPRARFRPALTALPGGNGAAWGRGAVRPRPRPRPRPHSAAPPAGGGTKCWLLLPAPWVTSEGKFLRNSEGLVCYDISSVIKKGRAAFGD